MGVDGAALRRRWELCSLVRAASFAEILPFILVGFAAQLVDGALGMAFGVISTHLAGQPRRPPAAASASVHAVEVFTTGASGISHALHKNVNWRLFRRIVIPGRDRRHARRLCADPDPGRATARPFVLAYLAAIGLYLLWRGLRHGHQEQEAPDRRAARPGRRLPRRGRRRRLGAGGHLATCSPRAPIRGR